VLWLIHLKFLLRTFGSQRKLSRTNVLHSVRARGRGLQGRAHSTRRYFFQTLGFPRYLIRNGVPRDGLPRSVRKFLIPANLERSGSHLSKS